MSKQPADLENFDAQGQADQAAKTAREYRNAPQRAIHLVAEAAKKAERNKHSLRKVISDLATLVRLVRAWFAKEYREVSWQTIAIALGAIIYFVNPFDAIPDFIPGVGYLDDALVIGVAVKSIKTALDAFRLWERDEK
ncbi:MAG: YkvA family protein [Phycisphaerae bacterium]|jgi:uncharacterized membrane protein YkvA (DUF1232 family)|nr:YkvA family protein [Phycisphaerae bacterium]